MFGIKLAIKTLAANEACRLQLVLETAQAKNKRQTNGCRNPKAQVVVHNQISLSVGFNCMWIPYFQSLSELNWQSLQRQRTYLNQCQTFKVLNGMDCIEFAKYWSYSGAQQMRFGHACTLQTMSSRVDTFRFSFFVSAPFIWDSLPANVYCLRTYNLFTYELKECLPPSP